MTARSIRPVAGQLRCLTGQLWRASGGAALVEFAIALPVLVTLGMYGTEIAYVAAVNLQVSQLAISVADNASRLGQTENSTVAPTVSEASITSIMHGALKQGEMIKLAAQRRVILTSLEYDKASGKQFIHWQRCVGALTRTSDYGDAKNKNGLTGDPIIALGNGTQKITAQADSAVMFVEVFYEYRGLFGTLFMNNMTMKREAAFIIRDDRNLETGITGTGGKSFCSP